MCPHVLTANLAPGTPRQVLGTSRQVEFLRFCGMEYPRAKNIDMENLSKYGRRYDRAFKEDAVALVASGRPQREVARDLAIPVGSLNNWVRLARSGQPLPQSGNLTPETQEQRELRRLRQENEYLRRQREILKKALGILSAEMPRNDTP